MGFDMLFSPVQLGNVELKNRIVWTGHGTGFGNTANDKIIAYNLRRARGGVGMIVIGYTSIHPTCQLLPNELQCWDDSVIPHYRRLTKAVHQYETKIVSQISHGGRQGTSDYSGLHLISPSAIPDVVSQEVPKEMEAEDIEEIANAFGDAALRVREGGFDGVEIHSGYGGYLIAQFLSHYNNRRADGYRRELNHGVRFALEVIDNIRRKIGNDYLVGMQLSGDEFTPGGNTIEDATRIAKILADTNKLDYLIVKGGTYFSANVIIPDFQHAIGMLVPYASAIRGEVKNVRIGAVSRIADPAYAESVLQAGHADFIGLCRPLICDPDWPKKARGKRPEEIRRCVACNQGCEQYLFKVRGISCVHNPEVGREVECDEEDPIVRPGRTEKKEIMVIGGGPAGMKAAERFAREGHRVTLYEKEAQLGGKLNTITRIPFREEFGGIREYLLDRLERLKVRINTAVEVDERLIANADSDVIVFATGARSTRVGFRQYGESGEIRGIDQENVVTDVEFLGSVHDPEFQSRFRGDVVVVDGGENHWRSVGSAVYLSDISKRVTYVTPGPILGHRLPPMSLPPLFVRLYNKPNVSIVTSHVLDSIVGDSVKIRNLYNGAESTLKSRDMVVVSLDRQANDALYFRTKATCKESGRTIIRIGDCLAPRDTLKAIHDGYRVTDILRQ